MYPCTLEILKKVKIFQGLTESEYVTLLSQLNITICHYPRNSIIYNQGEEFFKIGVILKGKLQLSKAHMTKALYSNRTLKCYDTFGEELIGSSHYQLPYSMTALDNCCILLIDGRSLFSMVQDNSSFIHKFSINLFRELSIRHLYSLMQLDYSQISSLKKRVSAFLLNYYEETGELIFTISFNRNEMASYLCVTRPALSKVLADLKKEGIIDYYKYSFKILNLEKLQT